MRAIFVLLAVVLAAGLSNAVDINACTNITSAGTYDLTASVSGAPFVYYYGSYYACMRIAANNVVLDCHGYTISPTGSSSATAVVVDNVDNATIRNCNVNGGQNGFAVQGSNGGLIENNNLTTSWAMSQGGYGQSYNYIVRNNRMVGGTYGLFFLFGNSTITRNYFSGVGVGFVMGESYNNVTLNNFTGCDVGIMGAGAYNNISFNNIVNSVQYGVQTGGRNLYYRNNVTGNTEYGFYMPGDSGNHLLGNNISDNGVGINVAGEWGEGFDPADHNNFTGNIITGNDGYGINASWDNDNRFLDNTVSGNGADGMLMENSRNDYVDPSFFCNNTGDGIAVQDSRNITITDSILCNNTGNGLSMSNVNESLIHSNSAYGNDLDGFTIVNSVTNILRNNTAYLNDVSGFSTMGAADTSFYNNTARYNGNSGFGLAYSENLSISNNTGNYNHEIGFVLVAVNMSVLYNNTGSYNNNSGLVLFNEANFNNLTRNTASYNNASGIEVYSSSFNILNLNTADHNNQSGIIVYEYKSTVPTDNNTIMNSMVYFNDYGITLGSGSKNTSVLSDSVYNNRIAQMHIIDTLNATITNDHYSGNAYGMVVEGQSGGSYRMTYSWFGEPGGSVTNLTNMSITDTFASTDNYTLNWTSRGDAPTINWHTFRNRFVNISDRSGTSVVDRAEWDWTLAETAGFNETNLGLWKYNSSGWTLMNASPNTGSHHLSLTSMSPGSDYGIFEFVENCPVVSTPGTFTMAHSYNGSTNAVYLPMGGSPQYACVLINTSNVIFDCNGYSINGNLTSGATAGIVVESGGFYSPRVSNITIRNCPLVRGYAAGVMLYNASNSLVTNVTVKNNSLSAATGFMLYYSPNVNLTNTLAENHTYNYYVNLNSDNVRITNSTARTSSTYGFHFSTSVQNGTITDSVAINNNFTGILMDGSGYPVVARNNVSNSGSYTADAGIIISSNNALVEDNTATGAVSTPASSWGYGFIIETSNVTFRRNLAYGNKVGIEAFGSGCSLTNNTARNNLQDGFAFYSEGDTISANDAFQNGINGFAFNYTEGAAITANRAFSNALDGFHMAEGSEGNAFTGNNATDNGQNGFYLEASPNNTLSGNSAFNNPSQGFYLVESDSNSFVSNTANASNSCFRAMNSSGTSLDGDVAANCSYRGFFFQYSNGTTADGCIASNNFHSGFETDRSAGGSFSNLVSEGAQYGFVIWTGSDDTNVSDSVFDGNDGVAVSAGIYVYSSGNVRLSNVSLYSNDPQGLLLDNGASVLVERGSIYNNSQYGAMVRSSNSTFNAVHFYGNGVDFEVNGTGIAMNMSGVVFDNPAGDYTNYTNLSINDTVASAYSVDWMDNSTLAPSFPGSVFSFAQKFINITPLSGTVSIDRIVWHWLDSELTDYMEARFAIYKYNGTWSDPGADLNTSDNTLSMTDVFELGDFAVVQLIPSDGEESEPIPEVPYDVSILPACQGFIVSVKDGGAGVADALITGTDDTHASELTPRYTNASGQAYFPGCGVDVSVKAAKSGRIGTDTGMADCGLCAECASDDDCALTEQCSSQQCVPVDCPRGVVTDHACELYECVVDADCPVGQSCIDHRCKVAYECDYGLANTTEDDNTDCADNEFCEVPVGQPGGSCKPITGCGEIANHRITPWECGDTALCPSCPEGEQCIAHACVQSSLTCPTTGIVGDKKTCKATEDDMPCANCDYVVTDPTGKNSTGKTDAEGNLNLPLNIAGNYKIALLKDGQTIKAIFVKALPQSQPTEEEKPAASGLDPVMGGLFLVILLAVGLIAFMYWRRGKGEKRKPEAKK